MSEHTPGPWEFCPSHRAIHARGGCAGQVIVASSPAILGNFGQFTRGDGHLIAAAPEMLETLEAVLKALKNQFIPLVPFDHEIIEQVIAKAKGESK